MNAAGPSETPPHSVTVTTGSRLHFGLLTHRPQSGREFGGLGVMIGSPGWQVTVSTPASQPATAAASPDAASSADASSEDASPADATSLPGSVASRKACVTEAGSEILNDVRIDASDAALLACADIEARIHRILAHWSRSVRENVLEMSRLNVHVDKAIPGHRGLGSGTQLGLAIGRALSELSGETFVSTETLAERTGRGLRSAVGTWGFESGGLIVDGGKLPEQSVGSCVARCDFPEAWRFLLIAPSGGYGLSGADEVAAFERLQGMPTSRTERLCRIALMDLLPAIADADITAASTALTEYGRVSGEYFSVVQGGVFADDRMAEIGRRVTHRGRGFFQTSWGPTCAALCASDDELADLQRELEADSSGSLTLIAARPLNRGASVITQPAD